jgi:hypothetical protein
MLIHSTFIEFPPYTRIALKVTKIVPMFLELAIYCVYLEEADKTLSNNQTNKKTLSPCQLK